MRHKLWMAVWVTDSGEPSNYCFVSSAQTEETAKVDLVSLLKKEWDWDGDDEEDMNMTVEQHFDQWDMYGLYLVDIESAKGVDELDYKVIVGV